MNIFSRINEGIIWRYNYYKKIFRHIIRGKFTYGSCPICNNKTIFLDVEPDPQKIRESYTCIFCNSSNRQRAIIIVLKNVFPHYKYLKIYEPSPWGAASLKLKKECNNYTESHYFPEITPGTYEKGFLCENLEKTTFNDSIFDLIITQDVFEHILHPDKAFAEIKRILKPNGAHIFTIPYNHDIKSTFRVSETINGLKYNEEFIFHGNPIDNNGSLVITDWGMDLIDYIYFYGGMTTTIYALRDTDMGLAKGVHYVFVSKMLVSGVSSSP